jgi:hypothetical protein
MPCIDFVHDGAAKHGWPIQQQQAGAAGRRHCREKGHAAIQKGLAGIFGIRRRMADRGRNIRRFLLDHRPEQGLLVGEVISGVAVSA